MGEKLVIGPINKGLKTDREPFYIDNDSFPTLINAYQWRGRIKRKRGTSLLGRLTRYYDSTVKALNPTGSTGAQVLDGSGNGNLVTGFSFAGIQANASIVPGSVTIKNIVSMATYTDPAMDGTLSPSGSINYATGAFTIAAEAGNTVSAKFQYYPDLPVMGLEDLILTVNQFPGTLSFDTVYSYNIDTNSPYLIYNVSFYKNPPTGFYTGYTQKTDWTPTTWNGQDYQQFWTVNYQGALWATNGITQPFSITNIGMQYNTITAIGGIVAGPPAFATITTATNHGLVIGDFVFINEVQGVTGINFQTGYVTAIPALNQITVEFPNATLGGAWTSGGIVQYLTSRSDRTKDCLRWYDGSPVSDSAVTSFVTGKGWVNFAPPLNNLTLFPNFSIADLPPDQYYLVGAKMIVPFKDRLLFFGPVIQTSAAGSQIYLQDTVIYSQNGTPYYTASFTGDPSLASTVFNPILVPTNQSAAPTAFWEDQTGFGGFLTAGLDQPMNTVSPNEDVLIVGFTTLQTRLVYSGNDIVPFNFFSINSELGSGSTFSIINMDKGVLTVGSRGFIITSQVGSRRFDLEIPDSVFEIRRTSNGSERITAQRDFIDEWCYFSYASDAEDQISHKFPTQTLFYNYRDDSWAIFNESYTTYGTFRKSTGLTWSTVGARFGTWRGWNAPWNSGSSSLEEPVVIAGNQQGFVLVREDDTTTEDSSLYIQSFSGATITSPDHCLNNGDFIIISGCLGTIASSVNNLIFQVSKVSQNTFDISAIPSGTYLGNGVVKRMYVPFVQTKQFPIAWGISRKTRIGVQQYLLTTTSNSQITLLIFLSQNDSSPYNTGGMVPDINTLNNALIYSTILYTCPESTNLGLTPANSNLQMPTAAQQNQTWHRVNTSLLGDTVQLGFTLSDAQMTTVDGSGNPINQFAEIELHSIILDVTPSQLLA